MPSNHCTGNPTFNEVYGGAFSEWPENLPGLICKTPPIGSNSAARFAQCCSGPVYNVTAPTSPDHPAYPVSCATLCQVDPAFHRFNDKYPYHWSDQFMCMMGNDTESSNFEVVCDTVTVKGKPAPTSFSHTPTGSWMTKTYDLDDHGFPRGDTFDTKTSLGSSSTLAATTGSSGTSSASTSASSSISSPPSSKDSTTAATTSTSTTPTPTSTSSGDRLSVRKVSTILLAASVLCMGWGSL